MEVRGVKPGSVNMKKAEAVVNREAQEKRGKIEEISEKIDNFVRDHPVVANAGVAAASAAIGYGIATGKNPVKVATKFVKQSILGTAGKIGGGIVGLFSGYKLTALALAASGASAVLTGSMGEVVSAILVGGGAITGGILLGKAGEVVGKKLGSL